MFPTERGIAPNAGMNWREGMHVYWQTEQGTPLLPKQGRTAESNEMMHRILKGARRLKLRDEAFRRRIRSIPKGSVATYGQVAAAAGYPHYHRAVAYLLRVTPGALPWHRVV